MVRTLLLSMLTLVLVACGRKEEAAPPAAESAPPAQAAAEPAPPAAPTARATLNPTQGNEAAGELTLTAEGPSVRVSGELSGLAPGKEHALHIHEVGDCRAGDASSAGDHFNPTSKSHGHPDTPNEHHAGDMYNVHADEQGKAMVDNRATDTTLGDGGPADVVGKAVVLHDKPDDYKTQPAGDSGARIACGVIQQ
jgi:superoxide dismutase, Cu-Zn family